MLPVALLPPSSPSIKRLGGRSTCSAVLERSSGSCKKPKGQEVGMLIAGQSRKHSRQNLPKNDLHQTKAQTSHHLALDQAASRSLSGAVSLTE